MRFLLTNANLRQATIFTLLFSATLYSCKKTDVQPSLEPAATSARPVHPSPNVAQEAADFLFDWFTFMSQTQLPVNPQPNPVLSFRNYSYIGVGLFEAVQPGITGGSSLSSKLYQMPAMPKPDMSKQYLWSESANAALSSLFKMFLSGLTASDISNINNREMDNYNYFKQTMSTPEDVLKRSEAFGRSIAAAIYEWSKSDNFKLTSEGFVPGKDPWSWEVPGSGQVVGYNVQFSRPFLKYTLTANAPPIPVPYSTDPSSAFYKAALEVHNLGGQSTATAANTLTARYWADFGGSNLGFPAPYHLLSIVTNVLKTRKSGLWKAAEVFAKVGIALKDGPIITFRAKFTYDLIRPVTYINRYIDAGWSPVLATPPYPEYTSGLLGAYGPVLAVLINELGDVAVTDNIYANRTGYGTRQFAHLSDLLQEASDSRIYGGLHYRFTQVVSIQVQKELADKIDHVSIVGPEYQ